MARALPHGAALFKTAADVPSTVERLKGDPRVEYAQPNFTYHCCTVNDPLVSWGITNVVYGVRAEDAWSYTHGEGLVVAVLDSGVDYNHPDLQGQVVKGYDFVNSDADPMDDNGHGTHVAGIIAAALNGQGVAGVAPGAKVMAVKVLGADGAGTTASIVDGINYAAQHGAKVVNMSFGSVPGGPPPCEGDKCLYGAIKAYPGVLFVAAAGNKTNDNDAVPVWPAGFTKDWPDYRITALPNIVSVAALAPDGALAGFSNYGDESVLLAAPGKDIVSTVPAPPADGGVALAVKDDVYGYRAVFWGFGAEDLTTADAVYDAVWRAVYGGLGITPADTQSKPLLVVDDDQNGTYGTSPNQWTLPDVSSYYLNALSTAGYVYTLYTLPNGADGPAVDAAVYSGVVWFTGHAVDSTPDRVTSTILRISLRPTRTTSLPTCRPAAGFSSAAATPGGASRKRISTGSTWVRSSSTSGKVPAS
ncbi:MAG: S8 family serine peptidase [Bacillota bacterium]